MSHITPESLARLVDERPDADEARHLLSCAACHAELDALREQSAACASLPDLEPAPESWPMLRQALLDEDLVRDTRRTRAPAWRIAASLALFALGGLSGFAVRGLAVPGAQPERATAAVEPEQVRTVDEATRWLQQTESEYLAALSRYSQLTDADEAADPAARLAALENIVITTREALNEAPADPLLNGYHLTAVAQRDAMLRQISSSDNGWF